MSAASTLMMNQALRMLHRSGSGGGHRPPEPEDDPIYVLGVACAVLGAMILVGLALWGLVEWIT